MRINTTGREGRRRADRIGAGAEGLVPSGVGTTLTIGRGCV
jgi:hypothetical protein